MIMIINLLFNFTNFYVIVFFLTKPLTLVILFSTAVNATLVAKPQPSTSVILELKSVFFLSKPLLSGIFLSASLIFFSKSDLSVSYVVLKQIL